MYSICSMPVTGSRSRQISLGKASRQQSHVAGSNCTLRPVLDELHRQADQFLEEGELVLPGDVALPRGVGHAYHA